MALNEEHGFGGEKEKSQSSGNREEHKQKVHDVEVLRAESTSEQASGDKASHKQASQKKKSDFLRSSLKLLPFGPWWVFLISGFFLPFACIGALAWVCGAVIRWRHSDKEKKRTPTDARFMMWAGRLSIKLLWLPHVIYLRFFRPKSYRTWRTTSSRFQKFFGVWSAKKEQKNPSL